MAAPPSGPPQPNVPRIWPFKRVYFGWAVVTASFLASFGAVPAHGPLIGLFFQPMEDELGWSRTTLSAAFTMGSMAAAFTTLLIGRHIDRYGGRMIVAVSGAIIGAALFGLSQVTEPWHYWVLFGIARAVSQAGIEVGAAVAVAKWFIRMRGRALGVRAIGLRSSQAIMPLVILGIISVSDWRTAWMALGVIAAVLIVLPAWLLMRRQPEDIGLQPDGDAAADVAPGGRHHRGGAEISWTLEEARKTRAFWLILFLLMMTPFTMGATNLHLVITFQDKGLSGGAAAGILSLFAAVSALAITPLSYVYDKIHVRHGAMFMTVLLIVAMVIIILADSLWMAILFGLVFGVATGSRSILETMLLANYFGRGSLGALRGFAGPFRMISPLGPLYAGFIRDVTGDYAIAYGTFAVIGAVMCLAMFLAKPPVHPSQQPAAATSTS
jgi:MFS family permease